MKVCLLTVDRVNVCSIHRRYSAADKSTEHDQTQAETISICASQSAVNKHTTRWKGGGRGVDLPFTIGDGGNNKINVGRLTNHA